MTCVLTYHITGSDLFDIVAENSEGRLIVGLFGSIRYWKANDYVLLTSLLGQYQLIRSAPDGDFRLIDPSSLIQGASATQCS